MQKDNGHDQAAEQHSGTNDHVHPPVQTKWRRRCTAAAGNCKGPSDNNKETTKREPKNTNASSLGASPRPVEVGEGVDGGGVEGGGVEVGGTGVTGAGVGSGVGKGVSGPARRCGEQLRQS